jgi:type VI secretion system secreted protein VgrG
MPPHTAHVSGIKSNTHKGRGYNQMTMDDTAGKEQITIHAQYDMNTTIEHSETRTIKTGTQTVTVKGDTSLTVQAGSRTVSVTGGNYSGTASDAVVLHGKGQGVSITGDAKGVTIIGTGAGVGIKGTPDFYAEGASSAGIKAPVVFVGDKQVDIMGTKITIAAGASSIVLDAGGISIQGPLIKIN